MYENSLAYGDLHGARPGAVRLVLAMLVIALCGACGSGGSGSSIPPVPPPVSPDWNLSVDTSSAGTPLGSALLGFYDISGALLDYENVPGLITAMTRVGFAGTGGSGSDWRIGLGRWELGTEVFATLTDGTLCANQGPDNAATFATDLDLIASRDWFTFTDGAPVAEADLVDGHFSLDYVRSVVDTATAFGGNPYVSIDLMPRAFSATKTPNRADCGASFTNSVSNNQPENTAVFAQAVAGLVKRVVEGTGTKTGSERPRLANYWEVWNEPELAFFWKPTLIADPDSFFNMAIPVLQELDAYRSSSSDPATQELKFGLASFFSEDIAITTLTNLDAANIPLDFISFHGYVDDPLVLVDAIERVESAIQSSANYQDIEMILGEWGPDLGTRVNDHPYAMTMGPALHAATVVTLGSAAGLDRAHNSIFYNYNSVMALGLLDNNLVPRPLYRGYELMAKVIDDNRQQLAAAGSNNGQLDAGMGAVLVSRDTASGTVRALLINRNATARTARITLDGSVATPTLLYIFDESDDPANDLRIVAMPQADIQLPGRSIAVAEF